MMMYRLICVFVLCFVFAGAIMASSKCVYGVCKPYMYCQTAQLARTLGKDISLCDSGGEKKLVCCYDNMASKVPFVSNAIYIVNLFNFATTAKPVRASTAGYRQYPTNTIHPQGPSTRINANGYGHYPGGTIRPQPPSSNTNAAPHPVDNKWPITATSASSYGNYPGGTILPSTNTDAAGYGPNPVGTNTNSYGNYPGGTILPSTNTNAAGYGPNPVGTNTNSYGNYPFGTILPQRPTTYTNTNGYGHQSVGSKWPITVTNTSNGHYPSGTNLPQRPSISTTTTARPMATTPPKRPTTTEYVPPVYDYVTNEPAFDGCRDLDSKLTTNKIGRPAWDKCIEYQQLVYPCQRSVTLLGNMVRANNCAHASSNRNKTAHADEFPHVVVLGYRRRPEETLRWACTGTLISERFTLSSAYCLTKRYRNDQIYAAVGFQQRLVGNTEEYQEYRMESINFYNSPHNGHNKDSRYHDIALLKSATDIRLNQWVIPACLDVFGDDGFSAVATRWHARSWDKTNLLQKVFVHQLSKQEYQNKFPNGNRVANQMGYGSYGTSYENCKFDNEGSLTVENHLVHCMHTLKGVFSSAIRPTCGRLPSGSYTRIADYASWIEQIVWPTEKKIVWAS